MDLIDLKQTQLNSWAPWAPVYGENIAMDGELNMWRKVYLPQVSIWLRSLDVGLKNHSKINAFY